MVRHMLIGWIVLAALSESSLAWSQPFSNTRRNTVYQNEPPATELVVARWHFGTNGLIGHRGWAHNYPDSDRNLNDFLKRSTRVDVEVGSYRIVELGSEEVFLYPFAYVSEPGEMELTDDEVVHLREFVERGGFVLVDDFDGPQQWNQFESQVRRAFPGRPLVPLEANHEVWTAHIPVEDLQAMSEHVPGGMITYYGLFSDDGTLAMLAGHNSDLANFWDWYADERMPLKPSTDAFRLGTNAVVYSLTH